MVGGGILRELVLVFCGRAVCRAGRCQECRIPVQTPFAITYPTSIAQPIDNQREGLRLVADWMGVLRSIPRLTQGMGVVGEAPSKFAPGQQWSLDESGGAGRLHRSAVRLSCELSFTMDYLQGVPLTANGVGTALATPFQTPLNPMPDTEPSAGIRLL